jgi:hypothetical protein
METGTQIQAAEDSKLGRGSGYQCLSAWMLTVLGWVSEYMRNGGNAWAPIQNVATYSDEQQAVF